ncbi:amidohydrolase 3 [Xylariales sp. PMI_506]|nr:amidohydrolase 3 [Xylariales sp. PMI_506]
MSAPVARVFYNGRFFQSSGTDGKDHYFAECVVADTDGLITHIGSRHDGPVVDAEASGAQLNDMQGNIVLPGFFDGHIHLLSLGQSLRSVPLEHCENLEDIRKAIKEYAMANPHVPRIVCKGWMFSMTDGKALASMIDDLDPRPIFIDEKSLHATWCNTAALEELDIADTPDPEGGQIVRDESGKATGVLTETCVMQIIWPHLAKIATMREKLALIDGAVETFNAVGYTGAIDMALDENSLEAIKTWVESREVSIRLAAHWIIAPRKNMADVMAQVDRAYELWKESEAEQNPNFRIVGIKLMLDGIIDACTAALSEPYATNGLNAGTLWTADELAQIVRKADSVGMQCALHAIGDRAVRMAVDALEFNATPGLRHRIEHLELAMPEDAARLGRLGITASIQPVHSDPAILKAWPKLIGDRCARAFAYKDFADGGAVLAIGSDAPTAPHAPLRNAYVAATRRSARDPELQTIVNPHFALELSAAIAAATAGSAYSCGADRWTGKIDVGLSADFVVVDMDWTKEALLHASVKQTWFKSRKVYEASP